LRAFENGTLRRIFEHKRSEEEGGWRIMRDEKFIT
jgi:hypothetical protein